MLERILLNSVNGKCDSITSTMRGIYKSGKNVDKNEVINSIYNLMKLTDERMVVIINNNNSTQVMNENNIKKYQKVFYDYI